MCFQPRRGRNPRYGQSLKEEVENLMECGWHIIQGEGSYPIRARGLMALGPSEGLLHYSPGDSARDHRDRGDRGLADMAEPR